MALKLTLTKPKRKKGGTLDNQIKTGLPVARNNKQSLTKVQNQLEDG